jgi:hypothetical protein
VAKPRSPILGYNHNVRYRGLVFHVQTEDSGIGNPHVFTHLFHGGVILSTRKLVYDADASSEAVKALMQSQHKAVLRDLKRGAFDDKIDAYLGGTPGLLPRGQDGDEAQAADQSGPVQLPPPLAEPEAAAEQEPPPAAQSPPPEAPAPSRTTTPIPRPSSIAIPPIGRVTPRIAPQDVAEARAPTERFMPEVHQPPARATPPGARQALTPPPVTTRGTAASRGVSAAFDAIVAEPGGGGVTEVPGEDAVIEIHSEAPAGAPVPPGSAAPEARPGSYVQHRRRDVTPPAPTHRAAIPAVPPRPPSHAQRSGTGPVPRPSQPGARPTPAGARVQSAAARTRSPSGNSGGVVVTRPAVIIGAPARSIGGTIAPSMASSAPKPAGRVRKAREDSDNGLFGQDLISEKSLDEVILAYLSEDSPED